MAWVVKPRVQNKIGELSVGNTLKHSSYFTYTSRYSMLTPKHTYMLVESFCEVLLWCSKLVCVSHCKL